FFQAEDGIRDRNVTGVQTCALPILPDNTDGEFCARGYNIMKGYYKMPEATAAVIDEEGWLHSGDVARRTPDGYYKITGRIKDMKIGRASCREREEGSAGAGAVSRRT